MKTETLLFKIFSDTFSNDTEAATAAVRDAKKAFTFIKQQEVLYRSNNFLKLEDE